MNLPTVTRYENHHVLIGHTRFTIEHPATCDLEACNLHARCEGAWGDPPASEGWYRLRDDLSLAPPEQRVAYALVRVADGQTLTAVSGKWCEVHDSPLSPQLAEYGECDYAYREGFPGCCLFGEVTLVRGAAHE